MIEKTLNLQNHIMEDIEDIKAARHEKLLDRNELKLEMMQDLASQKEDLNRALLQAVQNGEDVNQYRGSVDTLETELKKLYMLNARLGSIVEPVRKMYKDIVDEIVSEYGSSVVEVKA
jgi:ABC-type transporter lipoprotein component MlaA